MMKKNFKSIGFTLIELLATVVILGIITAMAFPMLRRISEDNMNRKLKTYANSIESSAKLYVDSYSEDLFGRDKSGSVCVTYGELKSKFLVKDIADNDISCASDKTMVQITKLDDVYTYDVHLECKNSKNSGESNSIIYPKDNNLPCNNSSATLSYNLEVNPDKYTDNDKKSPAVIVTLSSDTGINNKYNEIYYTWTLNPNNGNDTWNKLNFDIPSADRQKKDLISNKISEVVVKKQLVSPEKTGKWYLKIEVRSLQSASGDNLLKEKESRNFGPYVVDRTPPIVKINNIVGRGFNSKSVIINMTATDNNTYSTNNELKVCFSNTNTECSRYISYSSNNIYYHTFAGSYDGKNRTLYVWVKDRAGNKTKVIDSRYVVYKECSQKDVRGNWSDVTACSKKCDGGTKTQVSGLIDRYLRTTCTGNVSRNISCNTFSCCSWTDNKYGSWSNWSSCNCSRRIMTRFRTRTVFSRYNGQRCNTITETDSKSCACKPNRPYINNPTNGHWTKNNFSLNVGTSTPSNQLGYWYYRYNYTGWNRYDASYGKSSYTTTQFSAERNEPVYIRVCNRFATGPNDESNCSESTSTMIRIDKTPPTIEFYNVICGDPFHQGQNGYVPVTSKDSMSGIARRTATGHEDGGQTTLFDKTYHGDKQVNDGFAGKKHSGTACNYYINITVTDVAGNSKYASHTASLAKCK